MKRKGLWLIVSLVVFGSIFWLSRTVEYVDETYEGLLFQVGEGNEDLEEIVTVELDGEFINHMFSDERFEGTMTIDGVIHPAETASADVLEITFVEDGFRRGDVTYIDRDGDALQSIGHLHMSDDFSELTIQVWGEDIHNTPELGSWTSDDGHVISAPASDREEGLEVLNRLVSPIFDGYEYN
ncbi:hypothetical protein [Alkalibacillus haloalkaliphilus]|uniref:Uncharacterized protein n=1 Tax=Alkalibacillus haloalkaliphilus TaxID=94136 RepID=A0A511W6K2_9BACI|nr:hypothetical protein [Alkalibacillus haloalkaliphilus]GEN45703.1 hypothetical protein AHA02nite_14790 [Alkalibacillus haloalkaliphilus]